MLCQPSSHSPSSHRLRACRRAGRRNLARRVDRRSYASSCVSSRRVCNESRPQTQAAVTKIATGFHCGQQYSITALTNGGGTITERYVYDAYGKPTFMDAAGTEISGSADGNRILYTGREYEESNGLYYYRARWYSPVLGRFLSRDPISYEGGLNLFGYVNGQPLVHLDPTGLDWLDDYTDLIDPYGRYHDLFHDYFFDHLPGPFVDPLADAGPGVIVAGTTVVTTVVVVTVCYLGPEAVAAEVIDTAIEEATGIPIVISPVDVIQDGGRIIVKREVKEIFTEGPFVHKLQNPEDLDIILKTGRLGGKPPRPGGIFPGPKAHDCELTPDMECKNYLIEFYTDKKPNRDRGWPYWPADEPGDWHDIPIKPTKVHRPDEGVSDIIRKSNR